jgi:hypothetical protein
MEGGIPMTIATAYREELMYSGQRSYYLALALDARRALNALATGMNLAPAIEAIKTAAESLEALNTPQNLYAKLHAEGGYEHLEQLRTLEDVQHYLKEENLKGKLEILAKKPVFDEPSIAFARKFFLALESRALHYYDDPSLMQQSA